jgi:hypothetical protein
VTESRPPDFDWVTARAACSLRAMFSTLKTLAERDVNTRKAQLQAEAHEARQRLVPEFQFINQGSHFGVWCDRRVLEFCLADDKIEVYAGGDVTHRLTLTLTDAAECKFQVNGEGEFDPWQVLRLVLEPVFFG